MTLNFMTRVYAPATDFSYWYKADSTTLPRATIIEGNKYIFI